jgi:hypothetical protein
LYISCIFEYCRFLNDKPVLNLSLIHRSLCILWFLALLIAIRTFPFWCIKFPSGFGTNLEFSSLVKLLIMTITSLNLSCKGAIDGSLMCQTYRWLMYPTVQHHHSTPHCLQNLYKDKRQSFSTCTILGENIKGTARGIIFIPPG